jgi:hypothetical protein
LKDAQILEERGGKSLSEKDINLLISKELNNPQIKSLDFQSFLNLLVKLSLLKYPHQQSPKHSLELILNNNILPLLENIEDSIKYQKTQSKASGQ